MVYSFFLPAGCVAEVHACIYLCTSLRPFGVFFGKKADISLFIYIFATKYKKHLILKTLIYV